MEKRSTVLVGMDSVGLELKICFSDRGRDRLRVQHARHDRVRALRGAGRLVPRQEALGWDSMLL